MSLVTQLAAAVAPWADLYNSSAAAQTIVSFGHFGGMLAAGGLAVANDRATLRTAHGEAWEHRRHLRELSAVHPIIMAALTLTIVSGLLMFAADLEALAVSPAFWAKMGLVLLLLLNGWEMIRAEHALSVGHASDGRGWRRLHRASVLSLVLWFAVVLAGATLPVLS